MIPIVIVSGLRSAALIETCSPLGGCGLRLASSGSGVAVGKNVTAILSLGRDSGDVL